MSLKKTSVQLEEKTIKALLKAYPSLSLSEIVRLSLEFVVQQQQPLLERASAARLRTRES